MTARQKIRLVLMLITGGTFFSCLMSLFYVEIPTGNKDILIAMTGFLGGAFVTIITFYFGDSEGSGTPS